MAYQYFRIGTRDLSAYVNELVVEKNHNHVSQINASGDMVVDRLSTKRVITVGFIPMNLATVLSSGVAEAVNAFEVDIEYQDPTTPGYLTSAHCIVASTQLEYYTIQDDRILLKAFTITFTEL